MHSLEKTIKENQEKLANLRRLTRSLKKAPTISPATINDIAYLMENKTALRKIHRLILFTGLPMSILQWTTLLLGFLKHIWRPFSYGCHLLLFMVLRSVVTIFLMRLIFVPIATKYLNQLLKKHSGLSILHILAN